MHRQNPWQETKQMQHHGFFSGPCPSELSPYNAHFFNVIIKKSYILVAQNLFLKNSIRDACTPQPGEIVFNTMRYKSSETVQRSGYFQSSVSYIKVKMMFK